MSEFKPGLEGVVAIQTEIAEPDREGGALRYRGVDIEELVGHVSYEKVWGLLVDENFEPGMPDPEPYEPKGLSGNAPSDLQAETARLSSEWKLGKIVDIDDSQARDDLARLSAQMMSIVAKSAAVAEGREPAPDDVVATGDTAAEKFLLRWRGEADPDHVKAIDTYWICTAEHGLNASTFTARITASTGADCGAAMSAAVGALSGPLHGGAPARVLPMLDEVARTGDPEAYVKEILDSHGKIMGFGHRIYRAEDPRSRILKRTAKELGSPRFEVAEALEEAALAELRRRKPDYVIATNVEFYSAVVLDLAEVPPDLTPAMFACSRVAGWAAHILEEKRTGRLIRPSAQYVGPGQRSIASVALVVGGSRSGCPARRGHYRRAHARRPPPRRRRRDRRGSSQPGLPRARDRLSRHRPASLRPEDRDAPPRSRRRQPRVPGLGAPLAGASVSDPSRAGQQRPPPAAHTRERRSERSGAPSRRALSEERVGDTGHHDPSRAHRRRGGGSGGRTCGRSGAPCLEAEGRGQVGAGLARSA